MKIELAIVLVSGGMDSCVTAAIAEQTCRLAFLHVNYGQRTEGRELQAFNELANHFNAEKRLVVSIEHLKVIGGSSLTDIGIPVPESAADQSAIPNPYDLCSLPERPSACDRGILGRGDRREKDLYRRR